MTLKLQKEEINKINQLITDSQITKVESIIMFVGHAHSGHSLIGSLLDAHPDIAISNHVNIPNLLLKHNLAKNEIYKILLYISMQNKKPLSWKNTEYSYKQDKSFQGKTQNPIILGDKQGGASTRILMNNPLLLNKLLGVFSDKLKVIFVHRNVFDNIAAFSYYMEEELSQKHIDRYFKNLEEVYKIKESINKRNWFSLCHEKFISSPVEHLAKLYKFLEIKPDCNVENLTKLVNKKPKTRKENINWTKDQINHINNRIEECCNHE